MMSRARSGLLPVLSLPVLSLACLVLAALSLAACGNPHSPPENVARTPASGRAFAHATLRRMPDAARQAFRDKLRAESTRLDAELRTILISGLTSGPPDQFGRMAMYVQARKANLQELKRRIAIENGLLAQVDPEHVDFSGADAGSALTHAQEITTRRTVIAQAILMAGVEQRFLRRALATSPVLREASQRQDDARASGNAGTISYYIDEMKKEPCLFISPQAAKPPPISLRGVAPGMNRRTVLDTLCAAENGEVRIQAQATARTFAPDGLRLGARLLAWEAYRRGQAYSPDFAGVNAWLAQPESIETLNALARPYLKTTRFCLHCAGAGHEQNNSLSVQYAPEGTVVAIKSFQRFTDSDALDSSGRPLLADHASPRPLNTVLDPLRNQFGAPSFVFRNVAAWVYPDSETALQPEIWSVQPSLDGVSQEIRLNTSSFDIAAGPIEAGTPGFTAFYRALSAHPTPATYCVSKYAYDGLDAHWPLKAVYADRYGARPYDPVAAAPGETDHCGVIVYAVMDVTADDAHGAYTNDSTPVYSLTLSILNTARLSDMHRREARTLINRIRAPVAQPPARPVTLRR